MCVRAAAVLWFFVVATCSNVRGLRVRKLPSVFNFGGFSCPAPSFVLKGPFAKASAEMAAGKKV